MDTYGGLMFNIMIVMLVIQQGGAMKRLVEQNMDLNERLKKLE